jgi:GNAT superfamily N-acetyltransferase
MATLETQLLAPSRGCGRQVMIVDCAGVVSGGAGWVYAGADFFGSPVIAADELSAKMLIDALAARARAAGASRLRIGCGEAEQALHNVLDSAGFRVINVYSMVVREPTASTTTRLHDLTRVMLADVSIERMRDLHNEAFVGLSNAPPISLDETRHICERVWPDGSGVWLDTRSREHGFVWTLVDYDQRGKHALVEAIGVHANFRRRGVGAAILADVIDASSRAEVAEVRAIIARDNAPSLALHSKVGFRERSRREMFQLDL